MHYTIKMYNTVELNTTVLQIQLQSMEFNTIIPLQYKTLQCNTVQYSTVHICPLGEIHLAAE